MNTVTVKRHGRRFTVEFSQLPGMSFGPWDLPTTVRDLQVSARLTSLQARNLVLEATASGSAEVGMP